MISCTVCGQVHRENEPCVRTAADTPVGVCGAPFATVPPLECSRHAGHSGEHATYRGVTCIARWHGGGQSVGASRCPRCGEIHDHTESVALREKLRATEARAERSEKRQLVLEARVYEMAAVLRGERDGRISEENRKDANVGAEPDVTAGETAP